MFVYVVCVRVCMISEGVCLLSVCVYVCMWFVRMSECVGLCVCLQVCMYVCMYARVVCVFVDEHFMRVLCFACHLCGYV